MFKLFNNPILNIVFPLADFLHIYQLEEYDNSQYFNWCKSRMFKRRLQRIGELKWTLKAKILYLLSLLLILVTTALATFLVPHQFFIFTTLLILAVNFIISPLWLIIAKALISPLEKYLKFKQIKTAKKKLLKTKGLVVVAVAGSVGKTTTRHFLTEILKSKYRTFSPVGNYNTLLGISEEINTKMPDDTEVFVVELGEYLPGDLMKLAALVKPQIVVLTKVGGQHLEKFGSLEQVIKEFSSLLSYPTINKIFMDKNNIVLKDLANKSKITAVDQKGLFFASAVKESALPDAESTYENLRLVTAVARSLEIKQGAMRKVIRKLTNINQRLKVIRQDGITVIDDSYNISFDSAKNAFIFMESFTGRKVLVTGGVVEQGKESENANELFGTMIAKTMDIVIIASNRFSEPIARGISKTNKKTHITFSQHPSQTPILLAGILKNGDVVLVQNELPEVYWH